MMHLEPISKPGKCPAHVRPWTAEDDELLINLYPSMTNDQTGRVLGRSTGAIVMRVKLLHENGRLAYKPPRITSRQRRFIRDNRHTMTIREVAAVLGIAPNTVDKAIKAMGISYRKYGDMHPLVKYPDSDVELIRQLRDDYNLTFREIGEKFDISTRSCHALYARRLTAADTIAREYLPR
ncbi:AsnC family protein [Salmonella enterica]|nr:AsnC family protein [Salmonella enterica]